MHAVIYTRVSQDKKRQGKSVSQQEDECRLACAAQGWDVVEVFTDNDRSASRHAKKGRPGYEDLITYLGQHPGVVLVLWESSRGDRELERWARLLNLCRQQETTIHVVDDRRTYDLAVPRDWKNLADDGVHNAFASEETRQRVLRDVRATAAKGLPHGKLSFGYSRRYDERGNFIEQFVVPEQAAVLRESARRVLAGESCYRIARDLNERGLPSPGNRKWIGTEIKRLLINPSYVAKRVLNGVIVGDAVWPAIFDESQHHQLVALLTDPARLTFEDGSVKHLLTGLAACGVCGGPMRPQRNRTIRSYMCRAGFCVSIKVEWLEGYITEQILDRCALPDAEAILLPVGDDAAHASAEREANELQARLDGFVTEGVAGRLTPATLAKVEADLAPRIKAARKRARSGVRLPALVELIEAGEGARSLWEERFTIDQRRAVAHAVVEVVVDKDPRGPGHRAFDPSRLGSSRWRGDTRTWAELD